MTTNTHQAKILVVDDKKENLIILEAWLGDIDVNIVKATSGNEALARMLEDEFALVLLDAQMPGMDGYETAELMRGAERTRKVPIIFITAISKEKKYLFRGYESGAVDYIPKPPDPCILKSKVTVFMRLHQQGQVLKRKQEELHRANEKIKEITIHDPLTGCFSRGYLDESLPKEIKRAMRYKTEMSLVLTDIDHFKKINDTHGYKCGDEVLRRFGQNLQDNIRKDIDWVSRYGGEEFALVLPHTCLSEAIIAAERLRRSVADLSLVYQEEEISISASFGVAQMDFTESQIDEAAEWLLFKADKSLYCAKGQGCNLVVGGE